MARLVRGWIELASGDAARASQSLAAVVAGIRSSAAARFASLPLVVLAEAQLALAEREEAVAFLDEADSLAGAHAMTWILGRAARVRGELRGREGSLRQAESLAHQAIAQAREAGDKLGLVDALELLARLAAEEDSSKEAVRLWAAAGSLRSELGYARFPIDRAPHEAAVANVRLALDRDEFAAA